MSSKEFRGCFESCPNCKSTGVRSNGLSNFGTPCEKKTDQMDQLGYSDAIRCKIAGTAVFARATVLSRNNAGCAEIGSVFFLN